MGKATRLEKALEILEGGRETLQKSGIWCKGTLARSSKKRDGSYTLGEGALFEMLKGGKPFNGQVCAIGALAVQPGCLTLDKERTRMYGDTIVKWSQVGQIANKHLDKATKQLHPSVQDGVVGFNDDHARRKGQIIAIYDQAIANVKAKLAA